LGHLTLKGFIMFHEIPLIKVFKKV
jgi:hypothetical protein